MKKVAIIGAGFSGLSLAWCLKRSGIQSEVFEKSEHLGGMIQTYHDQMMVESAAHAFLSSKSVEELFNDLDVPLAKAGYISKSKWIFREGAPRKWPLTMFESLPLIKIPLGIIKQPDPGQTVSEWIKGNFSIQILNYLVGPALGGIYASSPEDLSATLIYNSLRQKYAKGKIRGSIAPMGGMGQLMQALAGVTQVRKNTDASLVKLIAQDYSAVVVATSLNSSSEVLNEVYPQISEMLRALPRVSISSVTVAAEKLSRNVQGFGCLFPRPEKFNALGVVFNTDLFENRGPLESETWIFNNSPDHPEKVINNDRKKLGWPEIQFKEVKIFSWKESLPLYGVALERFLNSGHVRGGRLFENTDIDSKKPQVPIFVTGNYLGQLGLAKILEYNKELAIRIAAVIKI